MRMQELLTNRKDWQKNAKKTPPEGGASRDIFFRLEKNYFLSSSGFVT